MADALDLGSCVERRVGSSPTFRTSAKEKTSEKSEVFFLSQRVNQADIVGTRRKSSTEPAATRHSTAAVIQAMK